MNKMTNVKLPKKFKYIDVNSINETYNLNGSYLYALININEIIYIGKSSQIINRLLSHKCNKTFNKVAVRKLERGNNSSLLESYLIFKFTPKLNNSISPNERFLHFRQIKNFKTNTGNSLNVKFVGRYPYFDLKELQFQNKQNGK